MKQQEIRVKLLLNKEEASAALSISTATLDRMVREGRIKPVKLGARVLFKVIDLEAFVENLSKNGAEGQEVPKKKRGRPRLAV